MKHLKKLKLSRKNLIFVMLLSFLTISITSCSSDDDDPETLEEKEERLYNEYVSEEMEANLLAMGLKINRGINPPNIEGYYLFRPERIATTVPNDGLANYIDYYKQYHGQKDMNVSLLGYQQNATKKSKYVGDGAFICGEGNKFSIFFTEEGEGEDKGISYKSKHLTVFSGELVKDTDNQITGIKNCQHVFYMVDNGGATEILIPNNTGRLFLDKGGITKVIPKALFDAQAELYNSGNKGKAYSATEEGLLLGNIN